MIFMRILSVFILIFISCEQIRTTTSSYEDGKAFYSSMCVSCHTANLSTTAAQPSLKEMAGWDSASIYNHLKKIQSDSDHHLLIMPIHDSTINDIVSYLRNFNRKQY